MFTSLLRMLDHPKIDIFIHFDAKNKSYDPAETLKLVKFSRVVHTPRIKVSWGAFSLVEAELILLEAATSQEHYGHYHLLSGADLPIKRTEDIIKFFEEHGGVEFVSFISETFRYEYRIRCYYPFQEILGRGGNKIIRKLDKICFLLQKAILIHRNKGVSFMWGSQWFSITDEFARYILSKCDWIRKVFHHTLCCDEAFVQTILVSSPFCVKRSPNMRLINWKRGSPCTLTLADLEQIKASDAMFARKFDPSIDAQVIDKIRELYS